MPSLGDMGTNRPATVRCSPDGRGAIAVGLGPGALAGSSDACRGRGISGWRIAVWAALLLALLTWPVSRLFSESHHATAVGASHRPGLANLPLAAQASVSAALGAATPSYAARIEKGALVTSNAAQRMSARFDRSGAHVRAGGVGFGLTLDSVGEGSSLRSLAGIVPRADANRVVYAYPGVSESFVNGPLGLDQRFTLARAPAPGAGPLTLSLSLSGDVRARVLAGGKGLVVAGTGGHVLDYRGLAATDARGRALHAWLVARGGRLLVHVDARGARYPVSIDPLIQQGPQLTDLGGEGEVGDGLFGATIALSSDGSTALIGAPREYRLHTGAAFVFVRSGSTWSQQAELQDSQVSSYEEFGQSVALSVDGNTAAIGAQGDGAGKGSVSVFVRSGSSWTEQTKLVADCTSSCANQGTGETSSGLFGASIGLSSDGNTLIAGAPYDETSASAYDEGAAWVFTRSGSSWTQQTELAGDCTSSCTNEGSGESTYGYFGDAVAVAGDGNTAVIGAPNDESGVGASWIFARSGSSWSEQSKLVADCASSCANEGTSESGSGEFGNSVAISGDGSTALIGGDFDGSGKGAAWIFSSSGASWTEQTELVGDCTSSCANQATGESGNGQFGFSTALSPNGDTAVIGARGDEAAIGAAWVLKRSGSSWTQDGAKLVANCTVSCEYEGTGETGNTEEHNQFGWSAAISSDGSTVMIGAPAEFNGGVWAFAPASTSTGLSVSPSTLDFGDIPEVQPSAPQTVTVTNPTGQALPLFVRANGSPSPAGGGAGRDRGASADRLVQNRGGMPTENLGGATCSTFPRRATAKWGSRAESETGHGRNNTFQHPGADRAQAGRRRAADVDRHGYGSVGVAVDPRFWGYPRSAAERAADGHGDEPDRSGAPAVRPRERVAEPGRDRGASADRLVQNRGGMSDREPGRRDCVRRSRVEPLRSGDRGQSETGHGRNNTFQHPGADRAQAGRRRAADVDRHGYGSVGVAVDPRFWGYPRSAAERAADGHGDEPDRSGVPAVRPRERVAEPGRDRGASADRLVQNRGGMSDREPGRRDCVRRSRVEPLRSGDRGRE